MNSFFKCGCCGSLLTSLTAFNCHVTNFHRLEIDLYKQLFPSYGQSTNEFLQETDRNSNVEVQQELIIKEESSRDTIEEKRHEVPNVQAVDAETDDETYNNDDLETQEDPEGENDEEMDEETREDADNVWPKKEFNKDNEELVVSINPKEIQIQEEIDVDKLEELNPRPNPANQKDSEGFKCEICGKTFAFKYRLVKHYLSHSDQRRFPCDQCSKKFKHKDGLGRHKIMIHSTNFVPFSCENCGKECKYKDNLRRHMNKCFKA